MGLKREFSSQKRGEPRAQKATKIKKGVIILIRGEGAPERHYPPVSEHRQNLESVPANWKGPSQKKRKAAKRRVKKLKTF